MTKKTPIKARKKKNKEIPNGGGFLRESIKDYARKLYLTLDNEGDKKYSNLEICGLLLEKFKKTVSNITITRWSKEWENDYVRIKTRALEMVKENSAKIDSLKEEAENDIDKELIDNQAANLALIYNNAKDLYILAYTILKNRLMCVSDFEYKGDLYNIDITAPYAAIIKMLESREATMLKLLESKKEEGLLQEFLGTLPDDVLQRLLKKIS